MLTVIEAAKLLSVSSATVSAWLADGVLRGIKPGRAWLVRADVIANFAAAGSDLEVAPMERLLKPEEATRALGLNVKAGTASKMAREGRLPVVRLGGKLWRVPERALEAFASGELEVARPGQLAGAATDPGSESSERQPISSSAPAAAGNGAARRRPARSGNAERRGIA